MSAALQAYLALESKMLTLESIDDAAAEDVRVDMDAAWVALSSDDRAWLNAPTRVYANGVMPEPSWLWSVLVAPVTLFDRDAPVRGP